MIINVYTACLIRLARARTTLKHAGSTANFILGTQKGIIVNFFCNQGSFAVKKIPIGVDFSAPQLGFLA